MEEAGLLGDSSAASTLMHIRVGSRTGLRKLHDFLNNDLGQRVFGAAVDVQHAANLRRPPASPSYFESILRRE
jgi:hypothetical protein